jgi:hypothetical protein
MVAVGDHSTASWRCGVAAEYDLDCRPRYRPSLMGHAAALSDARDVLFEELPKIIG